MALAMNTKQVIVMRRDLKMRRGKEIAQGAHASMAFLTRLWDRSVSDVLDLSPVQRHWLLNSFIKICCKVNSLDELMEIHDQARIVGLEVHLITDDGRTEFDGIPTVTCLAVGPDYCDLIDRVTGHLELL